MSRYRDGDQAARGTPAPAGGAGAHDHQASGGYPGAGRAVDPVRGNLTRGTGRGLHRAAVRAAGSARPGPVQRPQPRPGPGAPPVASRPAATGGPARRAVTQPPLSPASPRKVPGKCGGSRALPLARPSEPCGGSRSAPDWSGRSSPSRTCATSPHNRYWSVYYARLGSSGLTSARRALRVIRDLRLCAGPRRPPMMRVAGCEVCFTV